MCRACRQVNHHPGRLSRSAFSRRPQGDTKLQWQGRKGGTHSVRVGEAPQSPIPAAHPLGATWPIPKSSQRKGLRVEEAGKIITEEAREEAGEAGEKGLMKLLTR